MKFLRNVAEYTIKGQIRNTVTINELNIFDWNNRIQNNRLNWINDLERLKPECIPKQLMGYTSAGRRSTGWWKLGWKEERNESKGPDLDHDDYDDDDDDDDDVLRQQAGRKSFWTECQQAFPELTSFNFFVHIISISYSSQIFELFRVF
jgi:hypothetical protein